ncbi:FecR family protein [Chitinophaga sp. 22321]|uniref:FecR domain-containing protein n=1 Tax=Chitinophaga hostae TaxID=2831022 RepID=A0ABS5J868_9BACT|nr:FecR family protein [Chitinophaga hostae]MBS0031406.1 FecR domain-containing protein [Chitinophaga hostae]
MIDPQTWQRYIDNTGTAEERKAVLQWLQMQDDPALESLLEQDWQPDAAPMPAAIAKVLDQQLSHLMPSRRPRTLLYLKWLSAACIALLAGGLLWLQRPAKTALPLAPPQRITNMLTHVRKLTLTDGSLVWLAPGSCIEVPDNYNVTARHITLTGEAYFEVAPHAAPFQVDAGGLTATVLGTHFNIEAYEDENTTRLALSAGKISVRLSLQQQRDSTLVLTPGIKLSYKRSLQSFNTRTFSPEKEADWKRGAFVLEDVPPAAVFGRLENRYHKKIMAGSRDFKAARFTATYNQETLTDILRNMSFIYGFTYRETRDTVFIY